jgi:sirohydrochlorin cobaltochelatase
MKAVLLVSHGSRSPKIKEEISALADILRQRLPNSIVEFAFLEIETPGIPEGIDRCVSQGATRVVVTLNFLNAGRHIDEDIPAIVHAAQKKYPQIKFTISKPIGQHAQTPNLFIDLINNA